MENKLQDVLIKSGWYRGRGVDINQYLKLLHDEEYFVFGKALGFLKEYGELKIEYENPRRAGSDLILSISPAEAVRSIFRDVSRRYEKHCGEAFVIVGEIPPMEMTWYITSSGAFYGGNDDFLIRLGDDFNQALNNIINGVEFEAITIDEE